MDISMFTGFGEEARVAELAAKEAKNCWPIPLR
jgi:hypothetical protein